MTLSRYGIREWMLISIIAMVGVALASWLAWWWLAALTIIVWLALVMFFRDPWRRLPPNLGPGDMLSPADGTISKVFEEEHHEAVSGPAVVIRIFLSVLDVHINRSPFDATVVSITHRPGRYLDARTEESAKVNESNLIVLRLSGGETIGVRQVSGAIARRIVCPIAVGDRLVRGQRFGMIKFGSTTELILPRPRVATVQVSRGDKVRGGLTVLATITSDGSGDDQSTRA